jgi:hypothetical protein
LLLPSVLSNPVPKHYNTEKVMDGGIMWLAARRVGEYGRIPALGTCGVSFVAAATVG